MKFNYFYLLFILIFLIPSISASNNIRIDKLGTLQFLFPTTDGSDGYCMKTNGLGIAYWDSCDSNGTSTSQWTTTSYGIMYGSGDVNITQTTYSNKFCLDTNICMEFDGTDIYIG